MTFTVDAPTDQSPDLDTRIVVLDTSVIVYDPVSLTGFAPADVVIPLTVINELDSHKTRSDEVGRNAREAIRIVERLRGANGGSISSPAPLPDGGTLRIETNGIHADQLIEWGLDPAAADNRIIAAALTLSRTAPVTLISNDAALRIKAAHLGIEAEEYVPTRGAQTTSTSWPVFDGACTPVFTDLYADKEITDDDLDWFEATDVAVNEPFTLRSGSQSALCRRTPNGAKLLRSHTAWGMKPRNKEQTAALDLLLDPDIPIVALDGPAGTGKTLAALAAGLEQVVEQGRYPRLCIYRPIVAVGKHDLGYLPGSLDEKLEPWMAAIHDALVALSSDHTYEQAGVVVDDLTASGKLTMESVTHLRGRTIRGYVIVDEAQNLEQATLKTILTRAGEDTKVVFTGDTSQIDNSYVSEQNCALTVLTETFRGSELFGHVRLHGCERSEVADLAARLL